MNRLFISCVLEMVCVIGMWVYKNNIWLNSFRWLVKKVEYQYLRHKQEGRKVNREGRQKAHFHTPQCRREAGSELPWRSAWPPGPAGAASGRWRCVCRPTCRQSGPLSPAADTRTQRRRCTVNRSQVWMFNVFPAKGTRCLSTLVLKTALI